MFSFFSYRVLFQRFFPQNISLLPKIVTEAHANLKKKKTSCNTTLKHYQSWSSTPLWNFLSDLLAGSILFPFIHHQSIIKVHMSCGACIVHIFPRRTIILWTKRRPGSRTHASCSSFNCRNEKRLLNFVSEKIKIVYTINNTRYNFQNK